MTGPMILKHLPHRSATYYTEVLGNIRKLLSYLPTSSVKITSPKIQSCSTVITGCELYLGIVHVHGHTTTVGSTSIHLTSLGSVTH
ncbi:hypothetical protein M8J75_011235 [Diaphorina citri]|nr:hypothetical protein M8J75_011235 [Diaphorina citri]